MTLIICESLRQIGEMACVTSAWSSHGQTLNSNFLQVKKATQSNVTKCLGVYLDEHLTWKYHINFVCKQIAKSGLEVQFSRKVEAAFLKFWGHQEEFTHQIVKM